MHPARSVLAVVVMRFVLVAAAAAQAPDPDVVDGVQRSLALMAEAAAAERLWPGFRPDTMVFRVVLPDRGVLLVGWTASVPEGFSMVGGDSRMAWLPGGEQGAASTVTTVDGRAIAQLVVSDTSADAVAGLAAHEAFHVFQRSVVRNGIRFGRGENSYYISRYPVFDVDNSTQTSFEGGLLAEALRARTSRAARSAARAFVAVREARHRVLDVNVAEFEAMTELNEGLAEYVQVRTAATAPGASTAEEKLVDRLENLTAHSDQSVRLRYYVTGAAQALLLDRLGPANWKQDLMRRDIRLHDLLAEAVGVRDTERAIIVQAERSHDIERLHALARARADSLRTQMLERVEQVLAQAGVLLIVDTRELGAPLGSCSFDPQNLLQIGDGRLLHTRMLHACGNGVSIDYNTPVVEDGAAHKLQAVIAADDTVRLSANGEAFALDDGATQVVSGLGIGSRTVTATVPRARITRDGATLTVHVMQALDRD